MQCAEPVTGSSGILERGAKKRETKSQSSPGAVTITPRVSSVSTLAMSGASAATAA